jgi:predicted enzyme related to lactoylglutathione lyase
LVNSYIYEMKVSKITIATTNTASMEKFYSEVLGVKFHETKAYGTSLYSANMMGIEILLCPNEIAGVKAEQSRVQFDFIVLDLDFLIKQVTENGGKIQGEKITGEKIISVGAVDPDGNTLVFVQYL